MLQGINRIGKSWVGKVLVAVLFGFLIISFAIWGIGDIFRGSVRTQVATVGNVDISAETFRNAYQIEYQNLIRRAGRSITPAQARAFGLEQRVLARLVSDAALAQDTERLGLRIPDSLVIQRIQADPAFHGPGGTFDRPRFVDLLRQTGISEQDYVRDQRGAVARQQLAEGLFGALNVPLAMRETVHRFQTERRSAEYIQLDPKTVGEMPAPSDAQVSSFYEERKASFRAPEYRAMNVMVLDPAKIAKPETVSDEQARDYYARTQDERYGSPEKRAVQQILFPTRAEAEAASARIKSGTPFETIATERGVDEATLNLGTLTKAEIVDPATAEAAFALAEGGVSEPIEGRFGPALLRVTKIEPSTRKPFEEVSAEIKNEIARERARTEAKTLHDAIEDERAGAKPLGEIAKQRGLTWLEVPAVDRTGRDKAGQEVAVPNRNAVVAAAFQSEVGADTEAVSTPEGGYVWFELTGVEPAADRPLEAVRDQVVEGWRRSEISRALAEKARQLAERVDKGEAMSAIAAELGQPLKTAGDLARGQAKDGLVANVISRVFATPVGKASSTPSGEESRVLFKVTGASVPPFVTTTQESSAMETQLRNLLSEDLLTQYVADVQKRLGVRLYPENVRRAIGGES